MTRKFVLDSFAVLAFLQDEPGAEKVENLITADDTELFLSAINLGEVFYILARELGEKTALAFEAKMRQTPKIRIVEASWERVKAAAKLKARGKLSFADCFAAALAQELGASLVTGDPEFAGLEKDGALSVVWLPKKSS